MHWQQQELWLSFASLVSLRVCSFKVVIRGPFDEQQLAKENGKQFGRIGGGLGQLCR